MAMNIENAASASYFSFQFFIIMVTLFQAVQIFKKGQNYRNSLGIGSYATTPPFYQLALPEFHLIPRLALHSSMHILNRLLFNSDSKQSNGNFSFYFAQRHLDHVIQSGMEVICGQFSVTARFYDKTKKQANAWLRRLHSKQR